MNGEMVKCSKLYVGSVSTNVKLIRKNFISSFEIVLFSVVILIFSCFIKGIAKRGIWMELLKTALSYNKQWSNEKCQSLGVGVILK